MGRLTSSRGRDNNDVLLNRRVVMTNILFACSASFIIYPFVVLGCMSIRLKLYSTLRSTMKMISQLIPRFYFTYEFRHVAVRIKFLEETR